MKLISKNALKDLLRDFVFANTPKSFFYAILDSSVYNLLRDCDSSALNKYYDEITSRAKRTPLVAALAYTVLVALLVKSSDAGNVDSSRLDWGDQIADLTNQTQKSSQIIVISNFVKPQPKIDLVTSSGAPLVFGKKDLSQTKIIV